MVKSVWELCYLDSDTLSLIDDIQSKSTNEIPSSSHQNGTTVADDSIEQNNIISKSNNNNIYNLQDSIIETEKSCRNSLLQVDNIINVLNEISVDFEDVTGRTNSLMINCENLLEQQVRNYV